MLAALRERALAWMTAVAAVLFLLRFALPDLMIDLATLALVPLTARVAAPAPSWLGRATR
ncbi:hypothetical protein [Rubellimicrobium aerolatum]|uniref:AI-2E family transporter n=1 Tax=Rubellimicrobium aerolatum TaxID=490979 RepID=A0ABW0SEY0_9RHOB|nr:hypothetical protein [Rubellimicrobium aerolatum]MBP1806489.1 hypothetical protein [Rubellimicrobium aerolatum]